MSVDPITFEIVRHRLFRVVEEAVITLKHVSGSAITNEGHDLMVSSPELRVRGLQSDPAPVRRAYP
jgi:hypothetical protein